MASESQANVLLVDDRPENLLAMETILEDLGQNLIRATSGREALRFLLVEDVALILLDVQMPGLNGFELAELIRERERTQRTPIIFVSATSRDEQYVFKGYSLGAVDYMTKPFEPEILKSKVRFFTELFRQNQEIKRQAALIEQANCELDSLNSELEARVRHRTTQLETANRELESEIAVRKQSEARLATEHSITRALAGAPSLEAAAPLILKTFCDHLQAGISCLWLPDESGAKLSCVYLETSEDAGDVSAFIAETRRRNLARGVGLPGHVWAQNAPVWLPDTIREEKFPRAAFAASVGLHSGVGFPIKIGGDFYGVIEFFTRQPLLHDQALINMLEAIGSEIGQFIRRKRVEAERESLLLREKHLREQAEAASRLKDEFLATVSHELRTPLNAILGWGQILQSGKLEGDERAGALETIYRNAKSQVQLIDDLLDTSRLITGNLRLNLSPTPIVPLIEAAIDVVRPAAEAKGVTLSAVYNSADGETITCDSQRLQQMIWNLLTNGVKFTPPGGQVEIRLEQSIDKIRIIVNDTGQGIAPEFLPFVFDRFRQEDSSSTRMHNGLGLGLAIVRHLAELHGGEVQAASDGIDKGADFIITLPRSMTVTNITTTPVEPVQEETNGHKTDKIVEPELKGVRVLIVDDDVDTCEMLTFALHQWGAEAQASGSVSEAFTSITEWQPDVLLTDINMPGEDGYALINKLRSLNSENGANIPVIALTAMARPEDSEQALSAGFQLHLSKPVDIQELAEAIANLTKKSA
ncbi:MAG TPA: response regulator [Pyrinomonadaceae bacterium]|jgi:signal transduction histidine kinase/DNA-binding response OmpR family regulator